MSDQIAGAAKRNSDGFDPFDPARPAVHLLLVREAVQRLGWATMRYTCNGYDGRSDPSRPPCGFSWDVWLSLGVEGPDILRAQGLYLPSPFYAGTCPNWACRGEMRHGGPGDREFAPMLIPDDVPRFVLPHLVFDGDGAGLVVPAPALVKARRHIHEVMGVPL